MAVMVLAKKQKALFGSILIKIVLLFFIVYSIINLTTAQIRLSRNKQELEHLQAQEQELQLTNQELQKLLDDDSYEDLIERALRENGYVRSDEKVYTDITGN
jgi:cell division protein FtsB